MVHQGEVGLEVQEYIYYIKITAVDPAKCFSLIAVKGSKPQSFNAICQNIQEKKLWCNSVKVILEEKVKLIAFQQEEEKAKLKEGNK
jgi:hypothetical protein